MKGKRWKIFYSNHIKWYMTKIWRVSISTKDTYIEKRNSDKTCMYRATVNENRGYELEKQPGLVVLFNLPNDMALSYSSHVWRLPTIKLFYCCFLSVILLLLWVKWKHLMCKISDMTPVEGLFNPKGSQPSGYISGSEPSS